MCTVTLAAAGCAVPQPEAGPGNAELGVAEFRIAETASDLEIVGLDAAGAAVARYHLRIGMVTPPEWNATVLGREIEIEVRGVTYPTWVSAGTDAIDHPFPATPGVNALVGDPYVAAALARWNISYRDRPNNPMARGGETAYHECTENDGAFVPSCSGNGASSYCGHLWFDDVQWEQRAVCNPTSSLAHRMCLSSGASTACGTAGPSGCAVCGIYGTGSYAACEDGNCYFYL